jgi:hypothetical protein
MSSPVARRDWKGDSPVSRTLYELRQGGYEPAIVERSVPTRPRPTKIDLYGVADIEALAADHTLYVQVCRDEDLTDHFAKHLAEPRLEKLLTCATRRFEVWSWAKRGRVWSPRRYRGLLGRADRMPSVAFVELRAPVPENPLQTSAKS